MVTGCLEGTVQVLEKGEGIEFAAATPLLDHESKPLRPGAGSSIALGDVNGDGFPDMVAGQISGPVALYLNDGKGRFGPGKALEVQGQPILATDAGPELADWDKDGDLDLLLGCEDGGVRLFTNSSKTGLTFTGMDYLVQPIRNSVGFAPTTFLDEGKTKIDRDRSRNRAKPLATDWDGDGDLDLLVGDFTYQMPVRKQLAASEQDLLTRHIARINQVEMQLGALSEKLVSDFAKENGAKGWNDLSANLRTKLDREYYTMLQERDAYGQITASNLTSYNTYYTLLGQPEYNGFVWVYLRSQ